jgi:hypothetical protein
MTPLNSGLADLAGLADLVGLAHMNGCAVLDEVADFLARFIAYPNEHARYAHTVARAHVVTRRVYTSGWCSTHYRRLRSGQPMDAPIRR